jgi:hypothetical protein
MSASVSVLIPEVVFSSGCPLCVNKCFCVYNRGSVLSMLPVMSSSASVFVLEV